MLVDGLMDADGNQGFTAADTESSRLLRDGKVIAESTYFGGFLVNDLPPGKATYTFQGSITRPSVAAFSTRTDLTWTFTSQAADQETLLPMIGVRYQPKVNKFNGADRRPVTVLPIHLEAQEGGTVPRIRKLEIQVSGDDGKTWRKAVVTARGQASYQAVFGTPKNAKTISLKAHVVDAAGNTTDLTTIGAYQQ